MPASPGIGMHVEVLDPENKVVLSKFYASEGRFTFTSHTPGEHHICLHTNSTRWSLFAGGRLVREPIQDCVTGLSLVLAFMCFLVVLNLTDDYLHSLAIRLVFFKLLLGHFSHALTANKFP